MKKLRILALLLTLILLLSACNGDKIAESTEVPTSAPTEPAPDPVQIYEDAVSHLSDSANLNLQVDVVKRVYVDTQVFDESSSFDITYQDLDQTTFGARVVGDTKFGDVHEVTVDEIYFEGSVYSK